MKKFLKSLALSIRFTISYLMIGYLLAIGLSAYVSPDLTLTQWKMIWPYVWLHFWPFCLLYVFAMWIGYWFAVILCLTLLFGAGWFSAQVIRNWLK